MSSLQRDSRAPAASGASASGPSAGFADLLQELAVSLQEERSPEAFYGELLRRVVPAVHGVAGAVWTRDVAGAFRLEQQLNTVMVGIDAVPDGRACHEEALRRMTTRDRPVWMAPRSGDASQVGPANRTSYGLLLAPILVDREVAGVLEIWQEPDIDAAWRQGLSTLLTEIAGFAAAYLHRLQWRELRAERQLWDRGAEFACVVHASLDTGAVASLIANQGRSLVECDQLAVALQRFSKAEVAAVSGATTVATRSPVTTAMCELAGRVLDWGETLVYEGTRDPSLPPAVLQALDNYLNRSSSRALVARPLRSDDGAKRFAAVLIAENFTAATSGAQLRARVDAIGRHAGTALANALAHERASAGPVARLRHFLANWTHGKTGRKVGLVTAVIAAVVALLVFVPAPLRFEARGTLLPQQRQTVYATRSGKIVELKAKHGDEVHKGQELLFVEDLDAQLKSEQLAIKVAHAEQRLAGLTDQINKAANSEERSSLLKERINEEYELRRASAERDLVLRDTRNPRKAPVVAAMSGKLLTFDAHEQLLGKTVKPGDALLRIARNQGPWEIELDLPERALASVREGLRHAPADGLSVALLLASQPLRLYQAHLRWQDLGGQTVVKDNGVVLPVRLVVTDPELVAQLASLPVGIEVRARIDCGSHALGYVWFGEILEFLYERLLF